MFVYHHIKSYHQIREDEIRESEKEDSREIRQTEEEAMNLVVVLSVD